ncbi:MAG: FAD-binding protein, partial [Thiobacillus sp.]|nr:FAD-binding protein [Thiobacillus sp.]
MLSDRALAAFRSALGADRVLDDAATRGLYACDETPRRVEPEAVLFPVSHDEVAALARIAFEHRIALTPRGAGSGNVGGALPAPGRGVVSLEWMRRVEE